MSECPECHAKPRRRESLPSYMTPIRLFPDDGQTEVHKGDCPRVALSPEARTRLLARLEALREARGRALVSSQNYWVR